MIDIDDNGSFIVGDDGVLWWLIIMDDDYVLWRWVLINYDCGDDYDIWWWWRMMMDHDDG